MYYKFFPLIFLISFLSFSQNFELRADFQANYLALINDSEYEGKIFMSKDKALFEFVRIFDDGGTLVNVTDSLSQTTQEEINFVEHIRGDKINYVIQDRNKNFIAGSFRNLVTDNLEVVVDSLDSIEWKLTNETKIVNDYICQKAIYVSGNDTYIGWFLQTKNSRFAPFNFGIVPGIAVEIYNLDKTSLISLSNFKNISTTHKSLYYDREISIAEYEKYLNEVLNLRKSEFEKKLRLMESKIQKGSEVRFEIKN